ncbi:MAG: leucyl aminopeptidase [Sphingobacteriia bacterium]|nr:leucyl aminopeptidase [Sphingobacteriia bacterium]
MDINFEQNVNATDFAHLFLVSDKLDFPNDLIKLANSHSINLSNLAKQFNFNGKKGESFVATINNNIHIFFGIGKRSDINLDNIELLGGKCYAVMAAYKLANIAIYIDQAPLQHLENHEAAAKFASGIRLRAYRFDKYRTNQKPEDKVKLVNITFILEKAKDAQKEWKQVKLLSDAVYVARDLVCEPPNVLYPESFEERCLELKKLGVDIEVLDEEKMRSLGMNTLLGVGQGSIRESRVVVMNYKGGNKTTKPIAFLGKGVTFDSGGLSLKSAGGMEDMKYDMAGAATVTGLMHHLASRKAKVNVVGVIGLVENMPDGAAQRPSDVVVSMSGQTVEVINTDAEGRLVLADILWYTQDRYKPQFMVDLATLTGAITITFGHYYAGLFSNNDELADKLFKTSQKVSEKLWRLPLGEEYEKCLHSEIADIQHTSNEKGAGSITAAQFLHHFVNNTPWAHLDIASMAWTKKDLEISPKGPTAFGVRLLSQFVMDYYDNK